MSGRPDKSQPLTPDAVERRRFSIEQRGYDRDQVRAFLYEVAAALRLTLQDTRSPLYPAPAPAQDAPDAPSAGAPADPAFEAARILRAAHVSATVRTEEAEAVAKAIVEHARQEAEALARQAATDAEAHRDRARRVLVAAQEEAEAIVAEAEAQARRVLAGARQDAMSHAQQVSKTLEARADEILEAERTTLARLGAARSALSALIETLADAGPVLGPTVEILRLAVDARTTGEAWASAAHPPARPADSVDRPEAPMVRAAVARAVEAAAGAQPADAAPGDDARPVTTLLSEIGHLVTAIADDPRVRQEVAEGVERADADTDDARTSTRDDG